TCPPTCRTRRTRWRIRSTWTSSIRRARIGSTRRTRICERSRGAACCAPTSLSWGLSTPWRGGQGVRVRVPDRPEELPVPRRGDPFPRGIGARLVGPRGDPRVALFADVPILPVGLVPEAHGVLGIEARLPE